MLINIFNWFLKITAWLPQRIVFNTKVYYQDKSVQGRHIKGAAIIASNHTSVFDYAALLFVFFTRTLRVQMRRALPKRKKMALSRNRLNLMKKMPRL